MVGQKVRKILETIAPGYMANWHARRHDLSTIKAWYPSGGGYAGGQDSRKRKTAAFGRSFLGTEDAVAGHGLVATQLEAMDLYRNNPLARAAVEVIRRYCGHSKPRANSAAYVTGSNRQFAQEWDAAATDYFLGYWWNRADHFRRAGVTLGTLQDWFVTTQYTQGDIAYIWTGDGLITVEGIQIQTPVKLRSDKNIKNGFRFAAGTGRATHMYWLDFDHAGNLDQKTYHRVQMESVIFCPWYWRPASLRSVPRLHGVIDNLRDHEEIHDNTKLKVKHESSLLSIERAGSRKAAPGSKLTNSDGTETKYEDCTYGMRFKTSGKPGEDFMFARGDTPSAQYVPLMEYDAQLIATGIGIPYKALMNMFDGSWSSNKAVQTALKTAVMEIHNLKRDVFLQRFWNITIAQGIRDGHLDPAPLNERGYSLFGKCEWTKPYFPQQDQEKEERGRSNAFMNLTMGLDDMASEQQTTADELRRRHREDMAAIKQDAEEVGLPVEVYAAGLLSRTSNISTSIQEQQ